MENDWTVKIEENGIQQPYYKGIKLTQIHTSRVTQSCDKHRASNHEPENYGTMVLIVPVRLVK